MSDDQEILVNEDVEAPSRPPSRPQSSRPSSMRPKSSRPTSVSSQSGLKSRTQSRPSTAITNVESRPVTGNTRVMTGFSRNSGSASSVRSTKTVEVITVEHTEPEKGCWHRFSNCVGGMWSTRDMGIVADREIYARVTIRELIVYCLFLTNLTILTFGMVSSVSFYYSQALKKLFLNEDFDRIYQIADLYFYLDTHFLEQLYWEYDFDTGEEPHYICIGGEDRKGPCSRDVSERNVLFENRLIGLPRIRMLRVRNDSCDIHPNFQNALKACYASYKMSAEDTGSFGSGNKFYTTDTAWSYQSQSDLNGASYVGLTTTYSGGGATQNLHSLKNMSRLIIDELKELLWIDAASRFVSIDFTVYNPNINLFNIIKLSFELLATGGVQQSGEFLPVKLIQYVNSYDYFILGSGILHCTFLIYYAIEEMLEILKHGFSYFFGIWNMLDIIVWVISVIAVGFNVNSLVTIDSTLAPLLADPDTFSDFSSLGKSFSIGKNITAILVFFAWIKVFKYISFNKTMTQLSTTLSKCAKDVGGFSVMFFIVFFAFAQLGYILFGSQCLDYSNFSNAIFALLRLILGDFDFGSLQAANRIMGPGFFLAYVAFVFFILLNMFLAIINDTYTEVKEEIQYEKNDFEVSDYIKRGYNNVRGMVGNRSNEIDIQNAIKFASDDGVVTYEEIRQNLKKCNFSEMEIEMFFCRYDVDGDVKLDVTETYKILNDINYGRLDYGGKIINGDQDQGPTTATAEEYHMVNRRVERLEHSMGSIMIKIDAMLLKLDHMETAKIKRSEQPESNPEQE